MNKTINQYINQLHLDPKREAAVRKLVPTKVSTLENDVSYVEDEPKYSNGVYIVDLEGELYNIKDWNKGEDATGVALVTDKIGIIIAVDESELLKFGTYGESIPNLSPIEDYENDFNGKQNTKIIYEGSRGMVDSRNVEGCPPVEYCYNYNKGYKKETNWYLAGSGELSEIINNVDELNKALSIIANATIINVNGKGYWTSTVYSKTAASVYDWYYQSFATANKYYTYTVRPITNLYNNKPVKERIAELEQTIIKDGNGTKFLTDNGEYKVIPRQFDVAQPMGTATISNITNYQGLSIVTDRGTLGLSTNLEALINQNPTKHYRFSVAVMATDEESTTVTIDTSKFKIADPANNTITVPAGGSVVIECYTGDGYVFVKW